MKSVGAVRNTVKGCGVGSARRQRAKGACRCSQLAARSSAVFQDGGSFKWPELLRVPTKAGPPRDQPHVCGGAGRDSTSTGKPTPSRQLETLDHVSCSKNLGSSTGDNFTAAALRQGAAAENAVALWRRATNYRARSHVPVMSPCRLFICHEPVVIFLERNGGAAAREVCALICTYCVVRT